MGNTTTKLRIQSLHIIHKRAIRIY